MTLVNNKTLSFQNLQTKHLQRIHQQLENLYSICFFIHISSLLHILTRTINFVSVLSDKNSFSFSMLVHGNFRQS